PVDEQAPRMRERRGGERCCVRRRIGCVVVHQHRSDCALERLEHRAQERLVARADDDVRRGPHFFRSATTRSTIARKRSRKRSGEYSSACARKRCAGYRPRSKSRRTAASDSGWGASKNSPVSPATIVSSAPPAPKAIVAVPAAAASSGTSP